MSPSRLILLRVARRGNCRSNDTGSVVSSSAEFRPPVGHPGGAAFGPTSSDAVSEHGHGHHLFQTESETGAAVARSQLRARAQDLAGEASCVRSLCQRALSK